MRVWGSGFQNTWSLRTAKSPSSFSFSVPRHPLRNGHLNQMAYSLFLFMRDVADGDFEHGRERTIAPTGAALRMAPALMMCVIGAGAGQ